MTELVSIVVPCYNPTAFVLETIASIAAQTHAAREVIVVNDGSRLPESLEILEQLRGKVDRFIDQPNRGLPAARNAGFRAASGRLVVPLDCDDLIRPAYLEACLRALESSAPSAFAYTDCRVFGTRNYVDRLGEYNLYTLLDRNFLTYAALIRKEDWERAGGYDESMRKGYEDWEFWLRLGALGRFGCHVPGALFEYRKHGPSLYDTALAQHDRIVAYIRGRHPELYAPDARAAIKGQWSPAVTIVGDAPAQTISDVQVVTKVEEARADAVLWPAAKTDANSAELAALAVWAGESVVELPDGSTAAPRRSHGRAVHRQPKTGTRLVWLRHLQNAGLLSWEPWLRQPLTSAGRLIPLRIKERLNQAVGRQIFDLSFYLQFQPNSVLVSNALVERLQYAPRPAAGRRRVALVTPHLGAGGAESVLMEIACSLDRERFEILLLATQSRDNAWLPRWRAHTDHVYDLARVVPAERMSVALYSVITNWQCETVLVQNSLFAYAALPRLRKDVPDIRLIDLTHAIDETWDVIAATAAAADALDLRIAASELVARRLLGAGTPPERLRLVANGADLERFRPSPPAQGNEILFAGRLDPVKRPGMLVKIGAGLAAIRGKRDFRFTVAGSGPELDRVREEVRRAGLEKQFDFRGHVDEMPPLYAACDVVILPSRSEGVPLVVLEAMASGRPVVASKVGAVQEAVDGDCGVLIESGKREAGAFAEALHRLLENPAERARMGQAGRRKVEQNYDRKRTHEEYRRLFE